MPSELPGMGAQKHSRMLELEGSSSRIFLRLSPLAATGHGPGRTQFQPPNPKMKIKLKKFIFGVGQPSADLFLPIGDCIWTSEGKKPITTSHSLGG